MNKEVLLEEAKAIMSCHPSKDARAFARSVLLYFKEDKMSNDKKVDDRMQKACLEIIEYIEREYLYARRPFADIIEDAKSIWCKVLILSGNYKISSDKKTSEPKEVVTAENKLPTMNVND